MKVKTLKKNITVVTILIVMIPLFILSSISTVSSYFSAVNLTENSLEAVAQNAAERTQWELQSFINIASQAGTISALADPANSDSRKKDILSQIANQYGLERGNLIDNRGNGIDGNNYEEREYYQEAMKGNTFVSDPLVSKITGKITIIVAAPLWQNGIYGTTVVGCVYFVPNEEFLNDIVREINVSDNSTAYIISKNGDRIADVDTGVVKEGKNIITEAESDNSLSALADVHNKMISGENGFAKMMVDGKDTLIGYAPIKDSNGWSLAVAAPASDFLTDTYYAMGINIILLIVAAVISIINSDIMGKRIGTPVSLCTERIRMLSEGDLSSPVPHVNTQDETKILADATESLVTDLNCIISDVGAMLESMASGDFNVQSGCGEALYKGDFHVLIESVQEINSKLSGTLSQINVSANQVSNGSDQVSGGAQSLSQGATEQAASVEELMSTLHTIQQKVSQTTENCEVGKRIVDETVDYVGTAASEMEKLTSAMNDISNAAGEISKIIKAIEDIAFQTNILALNAAVEAARAGDAGKGFAVVADEVRNLASKSADAAHETAVLIERAIEAVDSGTAITEETAAAVENVEKRTSEVKEIVDSIATASEEQNDMINQATVGIDQIAGVVQNNSATAEESAAASEELSGQAQMLKQLVSKFKLKA